MKNSYRANENVRRAEVWYKEAERLEVKYSDMAESGMFSTPEESLIHLTIISNVLSKANYHAQMATYHGD